MTEACPGNASSLCRYCRARLQTRTCDLLRVKHENRFFSVFYLLLYPLVFNNLGHLLSLSR